MSINTAEKERQIKEFQWDEVQKEIQKDLSNLKLQDTPIPTLYKSLTAIFDKAVVDGHRVIGVNSPLTIDCNDGVPIETTVGTALLSLLQKSENREFQNVAMVEATKMSVICNENPFLHPLSKSLGITPFNTDFFEKNAVLSYEAYEALSKGEKWDENIGIWNTTLEKAAKDLSKYKKVKKLIYRDGKAIITTVYTSDHTGEKIEEHGATLESHKDVIKHALDELKDGDEVSFVDKGETFYGKITGFKHHAVTDKYGTATIKTADGKTYSKSLLKVTKVGGAAPTAKKVEPIIPKDDFSTGKFPTSLADFNMSTATSIGGSGDTKLITDKNGKKWVLKEPRMIDGSYNYGNGQLEQEALCDKLYLALGINAPKSSTFKEGSKMYKVAEFIPDSKTLGSISSKSRDTLDAIKELHKGFVADCLFANWDVIGASKDNILVDIENAGIVHRVDNGGALMYRAKGRPKGEAFGKTVVEIDTFRDSHKNPEAAAIFLGITDEQIKAQAKALVEKKNQILNTITLSEVADSKSLHNIMSQRIKYLEDTYVNVKETPKPKVEEYDKTKYPSKATADFFANGWDELVVEGNPGIKDHVKNHILQIEKDNHSSYVRHAAAHGLTLEEYKKKAQAHVEKIVGESEFFRATDIKILDTVLNKDKRFKSQFEVHTSHGSLSPSYRSRCENAYFGFKDSTTHDVTNRPIYGYFSDNKNGIINESGTVPPRIRVESYGEVTVKIKKSVALKKATVTFGDSLGSEHDRVCSFAGKPHFTSFGNSDPLKVDKTSLYPKHTYDYTEVQYHHQLKVEDIESIHFSPEYAGYEKVNRVIEIAAKAGIPVKVYKDR